MADSRTSLIFINSFNIHGAHSYWKQGALGAAGVRDELQLGRGVRRTAGSGRGHIVSPRAQLVYLGFVTAVHTQVGLRPNGAGLCFQSRSSHGVPGWHGSFDLNLRNSAR